LPALDRSSPNPCVTGWNHNKIHSVCPANLKCTAFPGFDLLHDPVSSGFLGQQEGDNFSDAFRSRGKAQGFRRLLLTITVRNEGFFLNPLAIPETLDIEI
jgi:hypothetical protein